MINILFSKEFAFSILLLSGTLKAILNLINIRGIPDLTLLSALLVTIIMIYHMKTTLFSISRKKVELIALLTLFYLFMIYSLSYTSSSSASITKTINFGTMALAFYFPLLVKEFNIEKFIISITALIFISSVIFLDFYTGYLNRDEVMILSMGNEEARKMTTLYLTISWLNGMLVLYYFFQNRQNVWIKWSLLLIALVLLLSAGGRGPLIFTVFVLGSYFLYQLLLSLITFQLKKLVLPIILMIAIIGSTIFIVSNIELSKYHKSLNLIDNTVTRLMGLVNEEGGGASAYSRVSSMNFSINKINERPFWGYGIGSYGYEKTSVDEFDYPHNLFLEIWFELGYIPLLIFLFLFYRIYKYIAPTKCAWCLALYFYFILNILKSSSLVDIRMMLGFYAIFITIDYIDREEKNINFLRIKCNG